MTDKTHPLAGGETITVSRHTLDLLTKVAQDAETFMPCDCGQWPDCAGTCTHSLAVRALAALRKDQP